MSGGKVSHYRSGNAIEKNTENNRKSIVTVNRVTTLGF